MCGYLTATKRSVYPDVSKLAEVLDPLNPFPVDLQRQFDPYGEQEEPAGDIIACAMCCTSGNHCNRVLCGQTSGMNQSAESANFQIS